MGRRLTDPEMERARQWLLWANRKLRAVARTLVAEPGVLGMNGAQEAIGEQLSKVENEIRKLKAAVKTHGANG